MPLNERSTALRATRVGASEVPAIMGFDPYRGPLTVWSRLVLGEQQPQTPRMAIGSALEAPIARLWASQVGERIRLNTYTRTRGNMAATADGFAMTRGGLLEIKWSSGGGLWVGSELPEPVRWQAIAQSAVYGQQGRQVTVVALVGAELREWLVKPTRAERREARWQVDAFIERYVVTGEIPVPMYPYELSAYLRLTQGAAVEDRRPATDDEQLTAMAYLAARRQATAADADAARIRDDLLGLIANDARPRVIGDGWSYLNTGERVTIVDNRKDDPE